MRSLASLSLVVGITVAACSSASSNVDAPAAPIPGADASTGTGPSTPQAEAGAVEGGPFAVQPDDGEGLVNESSDLDQLLERGTLATACARYAAGARDRRSTLLCGKAMFFDEGFGTVGVPKPIVTFLIENFPNEIGPGFEKLGMIPDPRSADHLPLGMTPGKKFGNVDTLAFSCASCHAGKLPDGRYAVGAPNHAYDYALQNLALAVLPLAALKGDAPSHDAQAIARLKPMLDRLNGDLFLKGKLIAAVAPLATAGTAPSFPVQAEGYYAQWKSGTMDFFIEPLPFNDGVHTVSKISALWGIPRQKEMMGAGMHGAMLGWTGSTASVENFAAAFVDLGGGDLSQWPSEKLHPLVEYIYSLRAPKAPPVASEADVGRGATLFRDRGCVSCHGGPRGSGLRVYTYEEIGTDAEMAKWADENLDGTPDHGLRFPAGDKLTHGIKSPRLVGLWAMSRFLHNGSVDTLDDLFCAKGPRGDIQKLAFGNGGHTYGCDFSADEKKAVISFLRSH